MQKRGQTTLFVVVAVVIAILAVVAILVRPDRLLIDAKGYAEEVTRTFEDCLESKLSYAVASQDFVLQPDLLLAKAWLERKTDGFAGECAYFPRIKGVEIKDEKDMIKSTASFDAAEFNDVTKIIVAVDYPMTIKKSDKIEKINKFSIEVPL